MATKKSNSKAKKPAAKKGHYIAIGWDLLDQTWSVSGVETSIAKAKNDLDWNGSGSYEDIIILDLSALNLDRAKTKENPHTLVKVTV